MTLKEGRRRGKAKWRMEKSSGYKESSSHSESKGGMTMVPVCLPLCCGAACVIMWEGNTGHSTAHACLLPHVSSTKPPRHLCLIDTAIGIVAVAA